MSTSKHDEMDLEVRSTSRARELCSLDLKVLVGLDMDARAPVAKIAKKIGLTDYYVASRMKSLEERGIIKRYESVVDVFRLGLKSYRIYLKLCHTNTSTEKEIVDYLCSSPIVTWCGSTCGRYDIAFFMAFKDHDQAVGFWNGFLAKYRQYVNKTAVTPFCGDVQSRLSFTELKGEPITTGMSSITIGEKDRTLLRLLASDCRDNLENIGKALGLEPASVIYRINNLVKSDVIKAFRPVVDMEKLGYNTYKVDLNLHTRERMKDIEAYALAKPGVSHLLKTIGWADIELQVYSRNSQELKSLLHEIQDQFPDDIQDYSLFEYLGTEKDSFAGAIAQA